MTHDDTGSYVTDIDPDGQRQLWWAPPDGFPRQPLPHVRDAHDAARLIVQHATGDDTAAERLHEAFVSDLLPHADRHSLPEVRFDQVEAWLEHHDLSTAPGWTPYGPGPVITRAATPGSADQHLISLDGRPVLDIEVLPSAGDGALDARVGVHDRREIGGYIWDDIVQVIPPDEPAPVTTAGMAVTSEPLPFGGWAIQAYGYDVAILERIGLRNEQVRVAVYDRTPGAEFLATEKTVNPCAALPLTPMAERLRAFAPLEPRAALAR